jgi:hypothetical protein
MEPDVHSVGRFVRAPAETAFGFLADPVAVGRWSLGCFDIAPDAATGLHRGRSLLDGSEGWLRVVGDPATGLIDYHVGAPGSLRPRIFARVVDGEALDRPGECLVILTAMRAAGMADARWARLKAFHEAEIWLIAAQIEAGAEGDAGTGRC